jgi:radical SAM superfamily enzyme YgiQ (UPF0313 family)
VSIDLADDQELVDLMVSAGFKMVFVGIETPDDRGLAECGKLQNRNRDLLQAVKMLQRSGLDVSGGFIVGFDSDGPDIFERQIRFIQKSGIVTAMVGLLNAPPGTRLFKRLQAENRIITTMSGDNMDGSLNFLPRMKPQLLMEGYRRILRTIYSQEQYFERIKTFLAEYRLPRIPSPHLQRGSIAALFRAVWHLGIWEEGKRYFWKLVYRGALKRLPRFYSRRALQQQQHHALEDIEAEQKQEDELPPGLRGFEDKRRFAARSVELF